MENPNQTESKDSHLDRTREKLADAGRIGKQAGEKAAAGVHKGQRAFRDYARENPLLVAGAALAAGLLIGSLSRRGGH